jgi:hypothetical protein
LEESLSATIDIPEFFHRFPKKYILAVRIGKKVIQLISKKERKKER